MSETLKTQRKNLINQFEYKNINVIKQRLNIFIDFIELNKKDIKYIKHLKKLNSYIDLLSYYIKELNLRFNNNQINKTYLINLKKCFYELITKTNNILKQYKIKIQYI